MSGLPSFAELLRGARAQREAERATTAGQIGAAVESLRRATVAMRGAADRLEHVVEEHGASVSGHTMLAIRQVALAARGTLAGLLERLADPALAERAPEEVRQLYREGLISQTVAPPLGVTPSPTGPRSIGPWTSTGAPVAVSSPRRPVHRVVNAREEIERAKQGELALPKAKP